MNLSSNNDRPLPLFGSLILSKDKKTTNLGACLKFLWDGSEIHVITRALQMFLSKFPSGTNCLTAYFIDTFKLPREVVLI